MRCRRVVLMGLVGVLAWSASAQAAPMRPRATAPRTRVRVNLKALQAQFNKGHLKAPQQARHVALQIVDGLIRAKKYKKLRAFLKRLLADKVLTGSAAFRQRLELLRVQLLWITAETHRRAGRYRKCGQAFEALAKRNPTHSRADALLWNAGACYELGGALWDAIRVRTRLVRRYVRSRHTAVAMYYLAGNYHTVLLLADAAGWYERFAARYPKRKETREALMWAIVLRGGLGQRGLMRKNVAQLILRYGGRRPALVARAFWVWVAHLRDHGKATEYETALGRYLRRYARRGSVDRTIQALAELGRIHWKRSCRIQADQGICRRIRWVKKRGFRRKQRAHQYVARNRISVATANRYFDRALKIWANGRALLKLSKYAPDRLVRIKNARHFAAQATFFQAERALDAYVRTKTPRGLRFDPKRPRVAAASEKRFTRWLKKKTAIGGRLIRDYMSVVTRIRVRVNAKKRGDPHWSVAAVQRTGVIYRSFAEALLALRSPKGATRLNKTASVLRSKALARYKLCMNLARNLRWYSGWAGRCALALHELAPKANPKPKERYSLPGYYRTTIDRAGFR